MEKRDLICHHPCGNECILRVDVDEITGDVLCGALDDTDFGDRKCPFFKNYGTRFVVEDDQ